MSEATYTVGIDLGTTNCLMAYTPIEADGALRISLFAAPQLVGPGEVEARPLLPSFLLLPEPHDAPPGALALPWRPGADAAVGVYARERGAELPGKLIASAKSWLSHSGIDRTAPVLPWEAPEGARRLSPVDASAAYLIHLRDAWNHTIAAGDPALRLERQDVLLTAPASFDPVARELTVEAARRAGLERLTLLEEPQAAFYAWLYAHGEAWRAHIAVGDAVLVCDVGGGTTDFSLIDVVEEDGNLDLRRVAVGSHILLGGDNMDLTLAYAVRAKMAARGAALDAWQFRALVHQCRKAKELLLTSPGLEAAPISILGRGSSLIGGTLRTELTHAELEQVLLEGFFPEVGPEARPQRAARAGLQEMGLPYEQDPAVTRHLAAFLGRHAGAGLPGLVLFNGGVMNAEALRRRVLDCLAAWRGAPVEQLASAGLDHAVAIGAAYYGAVRRGRGIRIRAGAPRAYYIGVESAMPAVPGIPTPRTALCVAPYGMEEGAHATVAGRTFGLVVGEEAAFSLLASDTRREDRVGEQVEDWAGEITEAAVMEALLPADGAAAGGAVVPVQLESRFTEVGTLELWCVGQEEGQRWKLAFDLRSGAEAAAPADAPQP